MDFILLHCFEMIFSSIEREESIMNIDNIKHMVEEPVILSVNGYDKDNDVFVCYGEYKYIERL